MQSNVESEWVSTYFPTSDELRHFKKYVLKIANDGVYAAKISVPMDLMVDPIPIEESLKLNHVQIRFATQGSTFLKRQLNNPTSNIQIQL